MSFFWLCDWEHSHCSIHLNLSVPPLFYKLVEEWGHFFLLEATSTNTMTWAGWLVQTILLTSSTDSCEFVVILDLQNTIQIFSSKNILTVDPWPKHFLAIFYDFHGLSIYLYLASWCFYLKPRSSYRAVVMVPKGHQNVSKYCWVLCSFWF